MERGEGSCLSSRRLPDSGRANRLVLDDVLEQLEDLALLVRRQGRERRKDRGRRRMDLSDERRVVDESEEAHEELAVHAVEETAVTRETVAKVLDAGSALEARGEEAAEWSDKGRERGEDDRVELERRVRDRGDVLAGLRQEAGQLQILR